MISLPWCFLVSWRLQCIRQSPHCLNILRTSQYSGLQNKSLKILDGEFSLTQLFSGTLVVWKQFFSFFLSFKYSFYLRKEFCISFFDWVRRLTHTKVLSPKYKAYTFCVKVYWGNHNIRKQIIHDNIKIMKYYFCKFYIWCYFPAKLCFIVWV